MAITKNKKTLVCPWWLVWTFDNPLRILLHDPEKLFAGLIEPGQTALDIGCGAGHFSLGLAQIVGTEGKVIASDLQPAMLAKVRARAERAGLLQRIQLHQCGQESIGLDEEGNVDLALTFWMLHEVPDQERFLQQIYRLVKPGGKLLIVEPYVHVSGRAFRRSMKKAESAGFQNIGPRKVRFSRAVLLGKNPDQA